MTDYQFTDKDKTKLKLFKKKSVELNEGVIKHMPKTTKIKWEVDAPVKVEGQIDNIAEKGLVVSVRQFMDGETLEFPQIVNILLRHHNGDKEKVAKLRRYKKAWEKIFRNNPLFGIGPPDKPLTNKEIFLMAAYANHIHIAIDDTELFNKYEQYATSWVAPMMEIQLHGMILAIQKITNMLRHEFIEDLSL